MKLPGWKALLAVTAILGMGPAGCTQSGLTTSEWFTHAQLSSTDVSKGDILVREGMQKNEQGDFEGALGKWREAASFFRDRGNIKKLAGVCLLFASFYLQAN